MTDLKREFTVTVYDDLSEDGVSFNNIRDWACDEGLLWLYPTLAPSNKLRKDPPAVIINIERAVCVEFDLQGES